MSAFRKLANSRLSSLPFRVSPKRDQKPLGGYPVPPEAELIWKNRVTSKGGYIQQSISPYQLKTFFPYIHTAPARLWSKFSTGWWHWSWPFIITYLIIKKMQMDAEAEIRNKFWY